MSFFEHLEELPPDPILGLTTAFKQDTRKGKIDLSVGIYCNEHLEKEVFKCVKKAEEALLSLETDKSYLPIEGSHYFIEKTGEILFTETLYKKIKDSAFGVQALGGTGGLRLGADLLRASGYERVVFSDPTWANHPTIFSRAGFKGAYYPYYDVENNTLKFAEMLAYLKTLPEKTVVLLQASSHNPTGCDLTHGQWHEVLSVIKSHRLIPFFDVAYQGFGEGMEEDVFAVRLFAEHHIEMLVSYSFSKNMGLYSERLGALFVLFKDKEIAKKAGSNLKQIIRANYSNPARHGSSIASYIFQNNHLYEMWQNELSTMLKRIKTMREFFAGHLCNQIKQKDYRYVYDRKGMFCYTGLRKDQVERLKEEYGIYMASSGRVNVVGLHENNIGQVIAAISDVMQK